jgi:hypothetical protein
MPSFNWICPHCDRPQTVTDNKLSHHAMSAGVADTKLGSLALERTSIGCANPDCNEFTLSIRVGPDIGGERGWRVDPKRIVFQERLIPRGASKSQPDYIPAPIREDYYEACLIRDLSPKASATLTRRCLQGMIRDFCGISKGRLIDEIEALKVAIENGTADRSVTEESVQAIDHVRAVGNIGAHMEKDIDLIVPVDPGEAQALIELTELLFDEWYGAREKRKIRLARIAEIKTEKTEIKLEGVTAKKAAITLDVNSTSK